MAVLEPYKDTDYYLWKYIPSLVASIVFLTLYLIMACLIGFRLYKTKTWFCSAFVIGCWFEVVGYCGRAFATNMTGALGPYIVESIFILIPPAFFTATIYMCLSRIIRLVEGDHLSVIKPRIVTRVFVLGDYLSFMVQGNASGLFSHPSLRIVATALVLLGLAIQLISFALFSVCALIFHKRIRRNPTARSYQVDPKWVQTLYMLYAVSILILIRSVFRIVEYAFGPEGYPMTHEWTLFSFDSIPMFLVTIIFFFCYPSNLVPKLGDDAAFRLERRATCDSGRQFGQSGNVNVESGPRNGIYKGFDLISPAVFLYNRIRKV